MFVVIRAVTYASLFIGFFLVYLPDRLIRRAGLSAPAEPGLLQLAGAALAAFGGALALWSIAAFALRGQGTPAPFDPPRLLVVLGPCRFVRNPMYIGAVTALLGAAAHWASTSVLAYALAFAICCDILVVAFEEPYLRRAFGSSHDAYCRRVGRWGPRPRMDSARPDA